MNINIYIDNANLLYTLKGIDGNLEAGGRVIDYTKMVKYIYDNISTEYNINKVFLFDGLVYNDKQRVQQKKNFIRKVKKNLEKEGIRFQYKLLKTYSENDEVVQKGVDMQLGLEVFEDILINDKKNVDKIILISGDGDFIPVIEKIKKYNIDCYVAFFNHNLNWKLKKAANHFIELDINKMEYKKGNNVRNNN